MQTRLMRTFTGNQGRALAVIAIAVSIAASSCIKGSSTDNSSTAPITEADAVLALSSTVTGDNGGFADQVYTADARFHLVANYNCGAGYDSTFTRSSSQGVVPAWSTSINYHWVYTCGNPASFSLIFSGAGNYSSQVLAASDTCSGSMNATGFETTANAYTVGGKYSRSGQFALVSGKVFTRAVAMTFSSLTVNKSTHEITGGTATATITGTSSAGASFTYTGTITFTGNKQATLAIQGGGSYTFSWL